MDEEQAEDVRYIFAEYAKGVDKRTIAAALNAQGKRYNGKPFTYKAFENMLKSAKYTASIPLAKG